MSVLYLLRHGQASFGQADYDRLSPLGARQAGLAGSYLRGQGLELDAVYCGSLARQRHTADALLEGLASRAPLAVLPQFNEFDSGPIMEALLPAMTREDPGLAADIPRAHSDRKAFQRLYEGSMLRWLSGRYDLGGGETWAGFLARVAQGLEQIRDENGPGRRVMVVTSGGPIAAVMRLALGLEDETALRLTWVIKNASLSSFLFDRQRMTLNLFNSTAHLEEAGNQGLITYR